MKDDFADWIDYVMTPKQLFEYKRVMSETRTVFGAMPYITAGYILGVSQLDDFFDYLGDNCDETRYYKRMRRDIIVDLKQDNGFERHDNEDASKTEFLEAYLYRFGSHPVVFDRYLEDWQSLNCISPFGLSGNARATLKFLEKVKSRSPILNDKRRNAAALKNLDSAVVHMEELANDG